MRNYIGSHKPDNTLLALIVIVGIILLVGFSYLVMAVYDIPVRKYLSTKRKEKALK